jgi:hypothetical protein
MNTQSINAQAGRRTEFVGTFIKASGAARTMRFIASPDKLRGGGLITPSVILSGVSVANAVEGSPISAFFQTRRD